MWWTMVIGGKISRSGRRRILPKTLGGKTFFQNAPTYRPVTLMCSRNKMLGESIEGGEEGGFGKSDGNGEAA